MVLGYDPNRTSNSTYLHHIASGTLSGVLTRAITCPFDVVKIRFQLQSEAGAARRYTGLFQSANAILRQEGVAAFWKGHVPGQMLSVVYGGVQFCSFEFFTATVHRFLPHSKDDKMMHIGTHGICGSLSSVVSTTAAQPFDILRTRFVAQVQPKRFASSFQALLYMISTEGYLSLYKGLLPAIIQIVPFSALQFGSRSLFDSVRISRGFKDGNLSEFVCGAGAGFVAKTLVYPLDLVKKRLQVQGFSAPTASKIRKYSGFAHCCKTIWRKEGKAAFFKGYQAAALKSTLTSGIIFSAYRYFRELLEPDP